MQQASLPELQKIQFRATQQHLPCRSIQDGKPAKATPQNQESDASSANAQVVRLIDGEVSAEAAIRTFVAASAAADDSAALLMVDPQIRPLFETEMTAERIYIDSTILEYGMFGGPQFSVGGVLHLFALRDIVRTTSAKIIETRQVDVDRVDFTIICTGQSYHVDEEETVLQHILAIRRNDRWYIFRPFGFMTNALRGDSADEEIIHVNRAVDGPVRESTDFEAQYLVPIETVHEHLVRLAQSPKLAENHSKVINAERHYASVVNRAKTAEYETREELQMALEPVGQSLTAAFEQMNLFIPVLDDLRSLKQSAPTSEE